MTPQIIIRENDVIIKSNANDIWLTQHEIADLFGCFVGRVDSNIRSILRTEVLDADKVYRSRCFRNGDFVEEYSLEMIIALAFRINTKNTQIFREWILKKISQKSLSKMMIMSIQNPILN